MNGLTFAQLRAANVARLPDCKSRKGEPFPHKPDASDWSPELWFEALVGEIGEYANLHKKLSNGSITQEEFNQQAPKELADAQAYLDILALRLGFDLGQATVDKFNEVSDRWGSDVRL